MTLYRFEPTGEVRELTDTDYYFAHNAVMHCEDVWLEGEYPIFRRVPHDTDTKEPTMPCELNLPAYQNLIDEDLEWLLKQPRTLEREHIQACLKWLRENKPGRVVPHDPDTATALNWIRAKLKLPAESQMFSGEHTIAGALHVMAAHAHGYTTYIESYKCDDKQGEIARLTVENAALKEQLKPDTAAEVAFARMYCVPDAWPKEAHELRTRFMRGDRSPELTQAMTELTAKLTTPKGTT